MEAVLEKPQHSEPKRLLTKSLCYTIVKNATRVLLPHSEAEKNNHENCNFVILLSSLSHVTENHRAYMSVPYVRRMLYYRRGAFSGLDLYASHDWWVIQNVHHSRFLRCHFVHTFGHNLQTVGHILAFYIPNDLSTIGDVAFWLQNCMQALTGELPFQRCIAIAILPSFYVELMNYMHKTYTSVLRTKRLLYCSRYCFSTLKHRASSNWKATLVNMYHHFLMWHFVCASSTSQNN